MIHLDNKVTYKAHETLAICDLNEAVKAKDADAKGRASARSNHTEICLLAQFTKRVTGREVSGSTTTDAALIDNPDHYRIHLGREMHILVMLFDKAYQEDDPRYIARLRQQLPMDIEVLVEPARK